MSKLTRALDKARSLPVTPTDPRFTRDPAKPAIRVMSIRAALEWAFAVERVSLDFDEFAEPRGSDTIWRLMQQGLTGCKVDGGGRSSGHDDAEIIAGIVSQLAIGCGGRGMAVQVATLARACMAPDWMQGQTPRMVPADTRMTKHGLFARSQPTIGVARSASELWGAMGVVAKTTRGRKSVQTSLCCPVVLRPSPAQIGAARRNYLAWYGALLELQCQISTAGLRTIRLTNAMPPLTPWRKDC